MDKEQYQQKQQQQKQKQLDRARQEKQLDKSSHPDFQFNLPPLSSSQGQPSTSRNTTSDLPINQTGPVYVQGSCAKRVDYYMSRIKQRPRDNNIEFWKNLVAEFYAPNANIRWCTSGFANKWQEKGYCLQVEKGNWACRLCKIRPTYGCGRKTENLAGLLKSKYESEIVYENLSLEDTVETQLNSGGYILLTTDKVTQEIVFIDGSLVVRKAKLKVLFSPDFKILFWEFCCWNGEERAVPMNLMRLQDTTHQPRMSRPVLPILSTTKNVTAQPVAPKPYRYLVSTDYAGLQLVKISTEPIMPQNSSTEANATTIPSAWVILQPPSLTENQLQQSHYSKMMGGQNNNPNPSTGGVDEGNSNNNNTSGGGCGGAADVVPPPHHHRHHHPKDPSSSSSAAENIFPVFEPNTSMFLDHIEPEEDEYEANLSMFFSPDHSLPQP